MTNFTEPNVFLAIRTVLSTCPEMTSCVKFMDENMQLCESPLEFLYDQQDFLVVGCLGAQGVGKSTIMSLLTSNVALVLSENLNCTIVQFSGNGFEILIFKFSKLETFLRFKRFQK